jgi:hypothetical protein
MLGAARIVVCTVLDTDAPDWSAGRYRHTQNRRGGIRLAFQDWNHVIGLAVGTGLTVKSAVRLTVRLVSWSRAKISRV